MTQFTLTISCDNAAFFDERGDDDEEALRDEVSGILEYAAQQVIQLGAGKDGPLFDGNGNRVGHWEFRHA